MSGCVAIFTTGLFGRIHSFFSFFLCVHCPMHHYSPKPAAPTWGSLLSLSDESSCVFPIGWRSSSTRFSGPTSPGSDDAINSVSSSDEISSACSTAVVSSRCCLFGPGLDVAVAGAVAGRPRRRWWWRRLLLGPPPPTLCHAAFFRCVLFIGSETKRTEERGTSTKRITYILRSFVCV